MDKTRCYYYNVGSSHVVLPSRSSRPAMKTEDTGCMTYNQLNTTNTYVELCAETKVINSVLTYCFVFISLLYICYDHSHHFPDKHGLVN